MSTRDSNKLSRTQRVIDPEVEFTPTLRDLGWDDPDFATFLSQECEQLRGFVLTNLRSRRS